MLSLQVCTITYSFKQHWGLTQGFTHARQVQLPKWTASPVQPLYCNCYWLVEETKKGWSFGQLSMLGHDTCLLRFWVEDAESSSQGSLCSQEAADYPAKPVFTSYKERDIGTFQKILSLRSIFKQTFTWLRLKTELWGSKWMGSCKMIWGTKMGSRSHRADCHIWISLLWQWQATKKWHQGTDAVWVAFDHYSDYGVEHRCWQSKTEGTVLPSSDAQGLGRAKSNLSSSITQNASSHDVIEVQMLACIHTWLVYITCTP